MKKGKDITGQKYGKLTAIRPTDERRGTSVVWECQCDCGNTTYVRAYNLTHGLTSSCGCSTRRGHIKDLSGQKFGKLTAICPTEKRIGGNVVWECQCDCGNIAYVSSASLSSGNTQSCGCLTNEKVSAEGVHKGKNLTGQKFGMLTAIRPTDKRSGTSIVWECRCDCGEVIFASTHNLTSGKIKSCGCLKTETTRRNTDKGISRNIVGQRFGKLTVIRPTERRNGGSILWECRCDCGNMVFATILSLSSGITRSCGCIKNDSESK